MVRVLDSNDIIEMFSHSQEAGQNNLGVFVVTSRPGERARYPPAWFFASEEGTGVIKKTIFDTLELIRTGIKIPDAGPKAIDIAKQIPPDHSVYYSELRRGGEALGFAVLVPAGYKVNIPKTKAIDVFSRIFRSLCYNGGAWA